MQEYYSVEIVQAKPMTADEFNEYVNGKNSERHFYTSLEDRRGYLVVIDGIEGWIAKKPFEKAYKRVIA